MIEQIENTRKVKVVEILRNGLEIHRDFLDAHQACADILQANCDSEQFRKAISLATHPIISKLRLLIDDLELAKDRDLAILDELYGRINDDARSVIESANGDLANTQRDHQSEFHSRYQQLKDTLENLVETLTVAYRAIFGASFLSMEETATSYTREYEVLLSRFRHTTDLMRTTQDAISEKLSDVSRLARIEIPDVKSDYLLEVLRGRWASRLMIFLFCGVLAQMPGKKMTNDVVEDDEIVLPDDDITDYDYDDDELLILDIEEMEEVDGEEQEEDIEDANGLLKGALAILTATMEKLEELSTNKKLTSNTIEQSSIVKSECNENDAKVHKEKIVDLLGTLQNEIIPGECLEYTNAFSEGFAAVRVKQVWHYIDDYGFPGQIVDERWHYVDTERKRAFGDTTFEEATTFSEGIALVRDGQKRYFINKEGKNVFGDAIFDFASPFCDGFALVRNGRKRYYINKDGKSAFGDTIFEEAESFNNGLANVKVNNKWHYIDKTGKLLEKPDLGSQIKITRPVHKQKMNYREGFDIVQEGGKYLFLDESGNAAFASKHFDHVKPFSEGFAAVKVDNRWHYIDTQGKRAFGNASFKNAESFSEGLALVENDIFDKYFINRQGQKAFGDKTFSLAEPFNEGVAMVSDGYQVSGGRQSYFINKKGEEVFGYEERFDIACSFSEGLAAVSDAVGYNYKWRYIDKKGEIAFEGKTFDDACAFSQGIALVSDGGKKYFINKEGNNAFGDITFNEALRFTEGYAAIRINEKWHFIDAQGNIAFDNTAFGEANNFSEGFAAVRVKEKWYFIDAQGNIAFDNTAFDEANNFSEGFAAVKTNEMWHFINKQGQIAFNGKRFEFVQDFSEGSAQVKHGWESYNINRSGERIETIADIIQTDQEASPTDQKVDK